MENNDVYRIDKTVTIDATVAKIWAALTQPAMLVQWVDDNPVNIDMDACVGGIIMFNGNLHGISYTGKAIIEHCTPCEKIICRYWNSLSEFTDEPGNYSTLQFTLMSAGNATQLHLQQHNFITYANYRHWDMYWHVTLHIIRRLAEANQ